MPGTAIGTQMGLGYPGTYARNGDCIIEARLITPTDGVGPAFGNAVVLIQNSTGGYFSDAAAAITAGVTPVMTQGTNGCFAGFAVREVQTLVSYAATQPITPLVQTYAPGQPCDVLLRGNISVVVKDPQAAGYVAGGKVYLRVSTNGTFPSAAVGDLEPAADGVHTIQLTNVYLATGLADANSVTEVSVITRNIP